MEIVKEHEVKVGQDIWFPASNINFLCRQTNDRIVCEEMLPDYDLRVQLYNAIYEFQGKLFLVPGWARKILVYEIEKKEFHYLTNETLEKYQAMGCKYSVSFIWKDMLYLFCRSAPYIVKIDLATEKIEALNKLSDGQSLETVEVSFGFWFSFTYAIWNECAWLPLVGAPAVIQFALEKNTIQLHRLPIGGGHICKAEKNSFWLYSNAIHKIFLWNCEDGFIDEIDGIDLDGANYEVLLEYDAGILKCWNCKKCIYIDVRTKKIIKEKKEELYSIFHCNECDPETEYKYFETIKKQPIIEDSRFFFENPLSTYIKFLKKEKKKDPMKNEIIETIRGQNIYFWTKGDHDGKAVSERCFGYI